MSVDVHQGPITEADFHEPTSKYGRIGICTFHREWYEIVDQIACPESGCHAPVDVYMFEGTSTLHVRPEELR